MTPEQLNYLEEELAADLSKFNSYSQQLKKLFLYSCWSNVSQLHGYSSLDSEIIKNPIYSLYIKMGSLSQKSNSSKVKECAAQVIQKKQPDLILLLLEREDLDDQTQTLLVQTLSDLNHPYTPFWLFKTGSSLSQEERISLLSKSVHQYASVYYYLIESQESGLSCGARLHYAQMYFALLAEQMIVYDVDQEAQNVERSSNLFRNLLSLFQKKEYYSVFYLCLVLGQMGFTEGYRNAGFLIDSQLVDSKEFCLKQKSECALALYLKAMLKGGDMRESLILSIEIYTKTKDIDKLELHIKLYEEILRENKDEKAYEIGAALRLKAASYLKEHNGMRYAVQLIETVLEMGHMGLIARNYEYKKLKKEYIAGLHLFSFKDEVWRAKVISRNEQNSN